MASFLDVKFDNAHTVISQPEVPYAGNSDLTWRFTAVRNAFGTHTCDKVEFFMDGELYGTSYWTKMKTADFLVSIRKGELHYVDHSAIKPGRDLFDMLAS